MREENEEGSIKALNPPSLEITFLHLKKFYPNTKRIGISNVKKLGSNLVAIKMDFLFTIGIDSLVPLFKNLFEIN